MTLALFALAGVGLRFAQQQFFPASDRPELVVDLSLPQNATITSTEAAAEIFEKLLAGDPNIDRYSLYVGQGAVRFYLPPNLQLAHDYFAQVVVVTHGLAEREAVGSRLEAAVTCRAAKPRCTRGISGGHCALRLRSRGSFRRWWSMVNYSSTAA